MTESRGAKAIMETKQDDPDPRRDGPGETQDGEPDAAEEAPVPDTYEYLRDAPWQGPYGDPNGSVEPDLDEGPGDDPWAEAWPDDPWLDESWPDEAWPDDPWPGDLGPEGWSDSDGGNRA